MKHLCESIRSSEAWLIDRSIYHIEKKGYSRFVPDYRSICEEFVQSALASITEAAAHIDISEIQEEYFDKKLEKHFRAKQPSAFLQAGRRLFDRGARLEELMCLVKQCRKSYSEYVYHIKHGSNREDVVEGQGACVNIINSFFDMIEMDIYLMWSRMSEDTERRKMEKKLRIENAFNKSIIENVSEGLCVYHRIPHFPFLCFTVWNSCMTEITGYTMEEINRLGWYDTLFKDAEARGKAMEQMNRIYKGKERDCDNMEIIRSDGTKRLVEVTTGDLEKEGDTVNILTLIKDITEQKEMEEALRSSEAFLRQITDNTMDIISITDMEGILQYVTPSHKKILGYECHEAVGQSIFDYLHPDDQEYIRREHALMVHTAGDKKVECRYKHKDGYYIHLEVVGTILKDEAGNVTNAIFSSRDITKRINTEKALRESEERYRCLIELLPDAIFVRDEKSILFANAAAARIIGADSARSLIGTPVGKWYEPCGDDAYMGEQAIQQVMKEGTIPLMEQKFVRKTDDTIINIETTMTFFPYYGQFAWLVVSRDISERKRLEELQKKMEENTLLLKEAREYDKMKTEFFANISHELRTPINVIHSALQMLDLIQKEIWVGENRSKTDKYLNMMYQNCYRLIRLVDNLIDITKIDSGYFKVNLENYNIVNIVEEITLSVADYTENRGIKLIFDTDIEEKIIACDPYTIERIMLNLFSNAIKFTEPGGTIAVVMTDKGENIVISVKDTGIGISGEKIQLIFERFIQVDKSLSRNHEGSGIGLSLVKSLVELHGGTVSVESEYGCGSEFVIELPTRVLPEDSVPTKSNYSRQSKIEKIHIEFSDIYM